MRKNIGEMQQLVADARRIGGEGDWPFDALCEAVEDLIGEVERLRGQYGGPVVHQDLSEVDRGFGVREAPMPRPR